MTRLVITVRAAAGIERLVEFLVESLPLEALETFEIVFDGLEILNTHSGIGRPVAGGLRELVISRGRSGYLALYAYDENEDAAFVVAIRHQREVGYGD